MRDRHTQGGETAVKMRVGVDEAGRQPGAAAVQYETSFRGWAAYFLAAALFDKQGQ